MMRERWEKEAQTGVSEFEDPFTVIGKKSKNKKMWQASVFGWYFHRIFIIAKEFSTTEKF